MALDAALSNLTNLLAQKRAALTDTTVLPFGSPILGFFKRIPKEAITGRDGKKEIPLKTGRAGYIWTGSEKGEIKGGYDPKGILPLMELKKIMGSFDITPEQEKAMASSMSKTEVIFGDFMKDLSKGLKARRLCHLAKRGDGVVARVDGAHVSGSVISCSTVPGCVQGDRITAFDLRDTDTASGASGDWTLATCKVAKVDYINKEITVDITTTSTGAAADLSDYQLADDDVMAFTDEKDQTSASGLGLQQHVMGFQGHISDGVDTVLWDADDVTLFRRVLTYLTLTRTTAANAVLNSQLKDAAGKAVNQYWVNYGPMVAAGMLDGESSGLVCIMSPLMLQRIEKLYRGTMRMSLPRADVKLPMGTFKNVPHIPTVGYGGIPAFAWWMWEDGFIATVRKGDFLQGAADAEWVDLGTQNHILPVIDGGVLIDAKRFAMRHFWNTACKNCQVQVLVHGLDTSDPT